MGLETWFPKPIFMQVSFRPDPVQKATSFTKAVHTAQMFLNDTENRVQR